MKGNIWGIGMKGVKLSKRNKKNLKRGVYQFSSRVMEIHLGAVTGTQKLCLRLLELPNFQMMKKECHKGDQNGQKKGHLGPLRCALDSWRLVLMR